VTKDEEVEETSEVSGKRGQEEEDAKAGDVAITEVDMIGDCRVRQSAIEVREWPEEKEGEVMFPGKVVGVRTPVGEDQLPINELPKGNVCADPEGGGAEAMEEAEDENPPGVAAVGADGPSAAGEGERAESFREEILARGRLW
jgi:hypothetical protein